MFYANSTKLIKLSILASIKVTTSLTRPGDHWSNVGVPQPFQKKKKSSHGQPVLQVGPGKCTPTPLPKMKSQGQLRLRYSFSLREKSEISSCRAMKDNTVY